VRWSRFSKNASRFVISLDGVHRGIVIVASARRRYASAQRETITPTYPMSIPSAQLIEMIRLSNGSVL
jgi:hypothetical protein